MNLIVEYSETFCILWYGDSVTTVPKPIGEAVQKLLAENRQLNSIIQEMAREKHD